jgi:bifunctional non-homologous end joining protein LigD
VCNDVATLVYLADQACITPHVWLSRIDRPDHRDQLIFDLDPPEERFAEARWAALLVRDLLADLRLPSVAKTTGGRGIHVIVPLDRRAGFDAVRDFARSVAEVLAARKPKRLTTEPRRGKRNGRLFLDVGRNGYAQHAVAPYGVRARAGVPVSTPLHWSEVEDRKLRPERFSIRSVPRRVERDGDPWGTLRARSLREPSRLLAGIRSHRAA